MKKSKLNVLKIILTVFISLMYMTGIIFLVRNTAIDSDKANHLLQAADIMSGNFFLKNWILTGITFFTTDLLFYDMGYLLAGVSNAAIYIANGAMIACLIITSMFVACRNKAEGSSKYLKCIMAVGMMSIPSAYMLFNNRVHTAAVICSLISAMLAASVIDIRLEDIKSKKSVAIYAVLFILLVFGTNGDKLFVLQFVIPVLVVAAYRIIAENRNVKQNLLVIGITVCGTVMGFIFEAVYFLISNADRNSYIESVNYSSVSDWSYRFFELISTVLNYLNANFTEGMLGDKWILLKIIAFIIVLIAVIIWARIIILFLMRRFEDVDNISAIVAFSVLMAACTFVFTTNSHAKYIVVVPYGLMIILIRNIELICDRIAYQKVYRGIIIAGVVLVFAGNLHDMNFKVAAIEKDREEVVKYLEENDMTNGYAAFWNASVMTIASENDVKVRHIKFEDGTMKMFKWFCRDDWYYDEANFIIVKAPSETERNQYDITEETVEFVFGKSEEKVEIGEYIIYTYDYNISERISLQ